MTLRYALYVVFALVSPLVATSILVAQDIEWARSNGPLGGNITDIIYDDQGTAWAAVEFGGGIYSSDDGGNSWTAQNGNLANRDCRKLVHDAENGLFFLATEGGGIHVTDDLAESWVVRNTGLDNLFLSGLFHQGNEVVWAGTQGSGPYRSEDNGLNWSAVNTGLTDAVVNDFAQTADGSVFAATVISGIQRTKNNGTSWERVGQGIGTTWIVSFEVDENDILFAGTNRGIFRSSDQGDSWEEINTGIPNNTFIRDIESVDATSLVIATSRGVFYSSNAGDSWTERSTGLTDKDLHSIAVGDEWLLGARRDAGIARSENQGIEWRAANNGLFAIGIWSMTRDDDGTVYAGSQSAVYLSEDDGDTWTVASNGLPQTTIWSVYLPSDGKVFAGLDGGMWETTDKGQNWTRNALNNVTVYALDRAPDGTIWAATSDGMFKSDDGGDSWEQNGLDDRLMTTIEIDLDGNIFASQFFTGIFRSINNGNNWAEANTGLFNRDVTSLASNTVGTWFAGTRNGVFYSLNQGQGWESVNSGLADREVLTLAVNQRDDLFAGTFSRGVFRSRGPNQDWEALNTGLLIQTVQSLEMSNFDVLFAGTLAGSVYRTEGTTNPVEIAMPDNAEICAGESVVLTTELSEGFPDYSQSWSPSTGLNDANLLSPTANPDETTWYYITVSDRSGFEQRDSVLITVNPSPEFDAGAPIEICAGESEQREFPDEFSYQWSPSAGISCTDCTDPEFDPAVTSTYQVIVTNEQGCSITSELLVTVKPKPIIDTEAIVEVCVGASEQLSASGGVTYSWSPATDLDDPNSPTPTVTPSESRTYTLTVTGENGCEATTRVAVNLLDPPVIDVSDEKVICAGRSASLLATGAVTYRWEPATGLSCTDCPDPSANPDVTTVYTVTGTDARGCTGQAQVTVEVRQSPNLDFAQDLYFGVLSACETSSEQLLSMSNLGTFPVTLRSFNIDDNNFSIVSPRFPVTLDAGEVLDITLRYSPQSSGGHQGNLTFDALPCPIDFPVVLRGENQGVVARVEPGAIVYTRQDLCDDLPNPDRSVAVTNSSDGVVTLQSAEISGDFTFSGATFPVTLAAGEATAFTISLNNGIANPSSGEFTVAYVSDACTGNLRVALNSEGTQLEVQTSEDVQICRGESTRLSAQAENAVTYSWSPTDGLDDPSSPRPNARPFSSTEYQVTVVDSDGCSATESVMVTVELIEKPEIERVGADLRASVENLSYEWLLNGIRLEGQNARELIAPEEGSYRVVVRNELGCSDTSDAVEVITTSVSERSPDGSRVQLYPNPVNDRLSVHISMPQARIATLVVYSAVGQRMLTQQLNIEQRTFSHQLSVQGFAPGVYYLVIEYRGGRIAAPFVRE